MTEKGHKIINWLSFGIVALGMLSGLIAYGVTIDSKTENNKEKILKVENKVHEVEYRVNTHDVKVDKIDGMLKDLKDLKEQNTQILVILSRLETKIENMEKY